MPATNQDVKVELLKVLNEAKGETYKKKNKKAKPQPSKPVYLKTKSEWGLWVDRFDGERRK